MRCRTRLGANLDEEGNVKCVQCWRRVLLILDHHKSDRDKSSIMERSDIVNCYHCWRRQRHTAHRQDIRRMRENHGLTTIVGLVGWRAWHCATALHRLLADMRGRNAISTWAK